MHRHWFSGVGKSLGQHWGEHRARHSLRHGARKARFFEQGDLRYVVLALIAEKPRYGYEVIKAIEEKLGGAYAPSPGVVYPTLTMLEELGFATQTAGDGPKKLYTITPEGEACLAENRGTVDGLFARMSEVCACFGSPAPQVVRAMKNLSTAVGLRLSRGSMTDEQANEIANAIDAAVKVAEQN
jgi:DNA-binding PadR family transcriptional regulator